MEEVKDGLSTPAEETQEDAGLDESKETKSKEADAIAEEAVEESEDAETKDPSKKESEPLEAEEEAEEIDIDDLINKSEEDKDGHKSGYEKRIDKLTARLKTAEERLTKYEAKESSETGKYTKPQLRAAFKKAFDNGDADLALDIMDYMTDQTKDDIRKEYLAEQDRIRRAQQAQASEWTQVVESYKDYSDPDQEIYAGSSKDLDITNHKSLLYQTAVRLFNAQQEELFQRYHRPGGQELVVADALQLIIKKKRGKPPKDKEKDLLKRKLAKEKRKSSLGSGGPGAESKGPGKPLTAQERLDEYLKDRKSFIKE